MSLQNALDRGIANVEIEGLTVDSQIREWCHELLAKSISYEEYLSLLRGKADELIRPKDNADGV